MRKNNLQREWPLYFRAWGLALLLALSSIWPPFSASAADCLTAGCHDGMTGRNVHPGDMECESCHEVSAGVSHPGGSMTTSGMCTECHAAADSFAYPHAPAAAGDCAACHNPHRPTADLLPEAATELCLSCHSDFIGPEMDERHGPILEDGCRTCHQPHGSSHSRLLVEPFPDNLFVGYTPEAYQLCFSCHDRNLLRFPDTSFATAFRDGERNLHFLHVNKAKRGRSCKLCHVIHAGTQPKLMAGTVTFGNWALPLNFRKSATGGSCFPGCHGPAAYDRHSGATLPKN